MREAASSGCTFPGTARIICDGTVYAKENRADGGTWQRADGGTWQEADDYTAA